MSKIRLANKSLSGLLLSSSLLGLFLTSCTVDVKHSNADVEKTFNEFKQNFKNLEESGNDLRQRVTTLEKGVEAKKEEDAAKKLEDEEKARLPERLFNKRRQLEVANNLAAESSTSFMHLQFARDSLVNAFELLNKKEALEQEVYQKEKLLESKLLEYREARDFNYTGFSETLWYLLGFKWLWGAFTGYAPTTYSRDQWNAYAALKEETLESLESLKQGVLVAHQSLERELGRVGKSLDEATSTAVSAAEQLKFKKLKQWVLSAFADRVTADEKFMTARGVFREAMMAALNSPETTLEERRQVVDMSRIFEPMTEEEVANLRALLDSPKSFKLMEFAYTFDNFREEKLLFERAVAAFNNHSSEFNNYFEELFQGFKDRQQLPLDLKRQVEQLEEKMKSWELKPYELENNLDKANLAVENSKDDTDAAQRIFDKLVNIFELGEQTVLSFKKTQALKAKLNSYEDLEFIKNAEFDAQNNLTKGSFLREFAMYVLGFKWLTASFSFLGQVFRGNGWEAATEPFKFSDATPEAAAERAEFFDKIAVERENTTQAHNWAQKDFEEKKYKLNQAIKDAQETFDTFAKTRGFAYAATGRSTLQQIYAQLFSHFTNFEKAADEYYSNKRIFLAELSTTDGWTNGLERFRNDYGTGTLENVFTDISASKYLNRMLRDIQVVRLQRTQPLGNDEVVRDMYKNLNFSYFVNDFNRAKVGNYLHLLNDGCDFKGVKDAMLQFMGTVANHYDTYLTKTRNLEQDLMNLTSKNALGSTTTTTEESTEEETTTQETTTETKQE